MARKYHTIIEKNDMGIWGIQFGDYDLSAVKEELKDYKANRTKCQRVTDFRIITQNIDSEFASYYELCAIVDALNASK